MIVCNFYTFDIMLKKLFGSEVRIKLLNQFLMHADQEFYLRELSNHFNISPRSVSMELTNLESMGLIRKRISGNQHYYSSNIQHPLFHDLKNIFAKTIGLKNIIADCFEPFKSKIKFSFIYGSIARGNDTSSSDIDLLIIGNVSSRKISSILLSAGSKLNREINFSVFSLEEIEKRIKNSEHFITSVFKEPKIFVVGDFDEFNRLGKKWLVEIP
ncbi:MAG: nucleotidyltransferase domain-containing protein [Candidatus Helarchaeota archaeon]|nr:nucleotidyltransferase domain-containing protein [Candidatus Helarchaeota archaeon]